MDPVFNKSILFSHFRVTPPVVSGILNINPRSQISGVNYLFHIVTHRLLSASVCTFAHINDNRCTFLHRERDLIS